MAKGNPAGDSEKSKKEKRKTEEEMGRKHQGMDGNGVWRFPEGSGRQGRVERYCCNVICGAPTTSEVKGLRLDGHSGHLGHVTRNILANFFSPSFHMKSDFDWPSGF